MFPLQSLLEDWIGQRLQDEVVWKQEGCWHRDATHRPQLLQRWAPGYRTAMLTASSLLRPSLFSLESFVAQASVSNWLKALPCITHRDTGAQLERTQPCSACHCNQCDPGTYFANHTFCSRGEGQAMGSPMPPRATSPFLSRVTSGGLVCN